MNPLRKIDKFYFVMTLVMIVLAIPVVLTVQTIFSAYITSTEILSDTVNSIRINKPTMQEALNIVYEDEPVTLEVKESSFVPAPVEEEPEP